MYKFNLEILRKYRKRQEEEIQKDLSDLKRKLNKEKILLKILKQKREDICKNNRQKKEFKAYDNLLFYQYLNQLDYQINSQNIFVKKAHNQYRLKYDQLIQAVKKRKIMDKLKEQGRINYIRESIKREQKNLDEMGILGFQRKNVDYA